MRYILTWSASLADWKRILPSVTQGVVQHNFSLLLERAWRTNKVYYGNHFGKGYRNVYIPGRDRHVCCIPPAMPLIADNSPTPNLKTD